MDPPTGEIGSRASIEILIEMDDLLRYASNPDDLQLRMSGIASDEWTRPDFK